jgi:hypothetical protein
MRYIALFMVLLLFFAANTRKLVKTKVTKEITMSLAEELFPMTDDDIARKYPSARRPVAMYTDPSRQVDLGVNVSTGRWREDDLEMLQRFYKSTIMNLYNKVDIDREEIQEINKRKFVVFEFTSEVTEENKAPIQKYTYIQYTVAGGQTLVFNFTCDLKQKALWGETAQAMMQTIKIKG